MPDFKILNFNTMIIRHNSCITENRAVLEQQVLAEYKRLKDAGYKIELTSTIRRGKTYYNTTL
jgi:hypothetical protein